MAEQISTQPQKKPMENILDVLRKFSPGTSLRTALDDLLNARMGALIMINKDGSENTINGGFKLNAKFSPQRLVELAKMDGAIVLSSDLKKIIYANALLSPNVTIKTKETGTRHQAGERTAKQLETLVIAVSERKNKITLFYGDQRQELEKSSEVLRRATETLQILEKQKEIYNEVLINFNILEINNLVTISDVCKILQRIEIIDRISSTVRRYLIELGKEGIIVSMRLQELTRGIAKDREMLLKDYFKGKALKTKSILENMSFDFLIETSNISRLLFEEIHDKSISSKGFRLLEKTNLTEREMKSLISHFKSIDKILNSDKEELNKILKNSEIVDYFVEDMDNLREKILVGKQV